MRAVGDVAAAAIAEGNGAALVEDPAYGVIQRGCSRVAVVHVATIAQVGDIITIRAAANAGGRRAGERRINENLVVQWHLGVGDVDGAGRFDQIEVLRRPAHHVGNEPLPARPVDAVTVEVVGIFDAIRDVAAILVFVLLQADTELVQVAEALGGAAGFSAA